MLFQRDSVTVIQKIFRSFSFNLSSPEQTSFTTLKLIHYIEITQSLCEISNLRDRVPVF